METERLKDLKAKVELALKENPETRNCDVLLTQTLIKAYYPQYYYQKESGEVWINEKALILIREDSVKRQRAIIQNDENKYLPDDENVRIRRKINQERWLEYVREERNFDYNIFKRREDMQRIRQESQNEKLF